MLECYSGIQTTHKPVLPHRERETSRPMASRSLLVQLAHCLDPYTYEGPENVASWRATARERELASVMGVGVDAIRLCAIGDLLDLRKNLASRNSSVTIDMWLDESTRLLRAYLKGASTDGIRGDMQSRSEFASDSRAELDPLIRGLLDVLDVVVVSAERN
ncbi:hypothetical protein RB596_002563 [Gaeumannomyces avenae]